MNHGKLKMLSDRFRVTVSSLPDREELVAEVFYDHEQWVEISQELGQERPIIQFYSPLVKECWEFPLEDALEALELARKKFLGMGGRRD